MAPVRYSLSTRSALIEGLRSMCVRHVAAALVIVTVSGCGGSASPGGPSGPPLGNQPQAFMAEFAPSLEGNSIRFTWNRAPDSMYVLELGRSEGASDIGVIDVGSVAEHTVRDPPLGRVFARVKTRVGASLSSASAEASVLVIDLRDYIEAVFLGTGRLTPSDGNHGCSATGYMRGFRRATTVSVVISATVSADKAAAIRRAAEQVSTATGGSIQVTISSTGDPDPRPGQNEVTSTTHPSPSSQGCGSDNGCTIHIFADYQTPGLFSSSRAVQPVVQTPAAYAHDVVGHGVLGLCHPDGNLIGGAAQSLMSAGPSVFSGGPNGIADRLTTLDLLTSQAVYAAGLEAGATASDFRSAGLIKP